MVEYWGILRAATVRGGHGDAIVVFQAIPECSSCGLWIDMKFPPNLEAAYQSDLGPEKIRVLKLTTKLGCLLFSTYGLLDYWAIPSAYHQVWGLRAVATTVTFLVLLVAIYRPRVVLSRYAYVVWTMNMMWAFTVAVMIALAKRSDMAWSGYYPGLMLICSAIPLSYLRIWQVWMLGLACVAMYLGVAIGIQGMLSEQDWPRLMMNLYLLVSSMIIGVVTAMIADHYSRQVFLLRHALHRDMEVAQEAKRQSDYLAEHDPLTELPNRKLFLRRLEEVLERARQAGTTVSVLFIDLDGFKPINDRHGHAVGDMVLRVVARRIRACVRAVDLVARLGGDEFVVAAEFDQRHMSSVERLRKGLSRSISDLIGLDANELNVTAAIGTAIFPFDAQDAAELIQTADERMYEVKRKSKAASATPAPGIVLPGPGTVGGVSDVTPV